jgi:hypothetical protein
MLLIAAVGIAFFYSCDKWQELELPEEKPFPVGTWHTTRHYFDLTVDKASPEELRETREQRTTVDVIETESYRLTFDEDGTGSGSGVLPDETDRYSFEFKWSLLDGKLTIETESEGCAVFYFTHFVDFNDADLYGKSSVNDIVWKEYSHAVEKLEWVIESSADNMVLSTSLKLFNFNTWDMIRLLETHTYRYTFERVK